MGIGNSRASWIDYRNPGIFMITMNKASSMPDFCRIVRDNSILDPKVGVKNPYSKLGFTIFDQLKSIKELNPHLQVLQYKIMPDHIHFLIEITDRMERPLGDYMAQFKVEISRAAIKHRVIAPQKASIFEQGFNDQYLRSDRCLDDFFTYIQENPYRLWVRWKYPHFFRRINHRQILGTDCHFYGNFQLLKNPSKDAVVVHRRYSQGELAMKRAEWKYTIDNGGVVVGAFIEDREKEVFRYAASTGGKIILISNKALADREKPYESLFNLCASGQLLIISPELPPLTGKANVSRRQCVLMNSFAEKLAAARLSELG